MTTPSGGTNAGHEPQGRRPENHPPRPRIPLPGHYAPVLATNWSLCERLTVDICIGPYIRDTLKCRHPCRRQCGSATMTGYETARTAQTAHWQHGELVQDRAPIRTSGAFYGVTRRQESSL